MHLSRKRLGIITFLVFAVAIALFSGVLLYNLYRQNLIVYYSERLDTVYSARVNNNTALRFYPPENDLPNSTVLEARIEGYKSGFYVHSVERSDVIHFYTVNYIRFAADGPIFVALLIKEEVSEYTLRYINGTLPVTRDGFILLFTLPGPGDYCLELPELGRPDAPKTGPFLVAFSVDAYNLSSETPINPYSKDFISVTELGIKPDTGKDLTDALRNAVSGNITLNGTPVTGLRFPPGIYRTGTLTIRSNISIYLEAGAVLKATDNFAEIKYGTFLYVFNASNVTICGLGRIDANSENFDIGLNQYLMVLKIYNCSNVFVGDVLLEDTNTWAFHILFSRNISVNRLKVFSGRDGIDPDSSFSVSVRNCFIISLDDSIVVKATSGPCGDIYSYDCFVSSYRSALKIGTETRYPMSNITFNRCTVFCGERAISLYAYNGGPIRNISWLNIKADMIYWYGQSRKTGRAFNLQIDYDEKEKIVPTPVENCRIENVSANWIYPSYFRGVPDAHLCNVTVNNIYIKVEPPHGFYFPWNRPYLFYTDTGDWVNITLAGLHVDWGGNAPLWGGIAYPERSFILSDVKETG